MSFLPSLSPGNVHQRLPTGSKFDNDIAYNRPTEFLDLGINAAYGATGVPEKIKGLVAVYPTGLGDSNNYVALHLDTSDDSSYIVNWGDGTIETLAENQDHFHVYNFTGITGDTSTTKSTPFRGYKQAIFEVTLSGSAKFSQINFNVEGPFTTTTSNRRGSNILDLFVSTSNATNVIINDQRPLRICEQIEIRNTSSNRIASPRQLYVNATSLQSIPFVPWIRNNAATDYLSAFNNCHRLQFLPDEFASQDKFWFKNMSRFQTCFSNCYNLQYLPEGLFGNSEQSNCGSYYNAFTQCRKLRYIPYLGVRTGAGEDCNLRNVFNECNSLTKIPEGFAFQRANNDGIQNLCYFNFSLKDFSSVFDGVTDALQIFNRDTVKLNSLFAGLRQITEFPFVGQFNKGNQLSNLFYLSRGIVSFSPLYTHLDFSNATTISRAFGDMDSLREVPEIRVRALSSNNALKDLFQQCRNLISVKITGMISGSGNGSYQRMFVNCFSLQCIDGVDFSFADANGDYSQMFNFSGNISIIRFSGTFRAGYASPRINVTVNGHADVSGEYQIATNGVDYNQLGGDGVIYRTGPNGSGEYQWSFVDNSDGSPSHSTSFEASTEKTPHLATTWPSNTLTFSEVETGFKYNVDLKDKPIQRTQMLEIFNQLVTVSHSATLDIRNNSFTADLTDDDKAIATNKGWTLNI
jgi:hypothetical protein